MPNLVKLLIIPDAPKEAPTMAIRLARVIHWISIAVAALAATLGLLMLVSGSHEGPVVFLGCVAASLAILLAGRAVRYILASE